MTALLLDTNSLFFRAHHALPPMCTTGGEPTSALYGLSVLLLKLLREHRPTELAFARDLPQPTFRHRSYDAYKAGRPPMPDGLKPQWRRLDQLLDASGVPAHAAPGFEADDVLATLTRRLTERSPDGDVLVVSGDRDLFQLIEPRVRVLFVGARQQKPELVDARVVQERYGVPPDRLPMLSALVGEAADNIQGVAGVGVKTAAKLVLAHGSMQALVDRLDAVAPPKLQASLRDARERILMNDRLTRLERELELEGPLTGPLTAEGRGRLRGLFEELEFKSLLPRLDALATA